MIELYSTVVIIMYRKVKYWSMDKPVNWSMTSCPVVILHRTTDSCLLPILCSMCLKSVGSPISILFKWPMLCDLLGLGDDEGL